MKLLPLLCLCSLLFTGSTQAADLSQLIEQRLGYMQAVAAYKWQQQRPVEDLQRERQVLANTRVQALRQHLNAGQSEAFFELQMQAAKEIQHFWVARWRDGTAAAPTDVTDLNELRGQLNQLGEDIIAALATNRGPVTPPEVEGLSAQSAAQLAASAAAVQRYGNTLDQVLDSGLLRVGYTADYAPFSAPGQADGEAPVGIDADLAKDLATSLGVELLWVKTSWPTLMADLAAGAYDIGMSGISHNLKRARNAMFSAPYYSGGKAAIGHCSAQGELNSLEAIDAPDVTVIVNPGGTNQAFVNANIRRAEVLVHPDNNTIFARLAAGDADVMITDRIEVELQSAIHPELCPLLADNLLSFSEKAYLMPRDAIWKAYVDSWLQQRIGEGVVAARIAAHLENLSD